MTASVDLLKNELDYQIVVRGTQAEVLAADPSSPRNGDVVPIGICTDTEAVLVWVNGAWKSGGMVSFDDPSQIPSGVDLGPTISVAGETWYWSSTRNRYIPGQMVSKATYTDLTTLATQMGLGNNAASIGIKVWLVNPLAPGGMTRMYWTGTLWAPVEGQRLYYAKGTLLDMTAAALSIGAWNEVWQSPVLPGWMILQGDPNISLSADVELADTVSTAVSKLRMNLLPGATGLGDENAGFFGFGGAASQYGKGFSGGRARGSVVGGSLWATSGSQPFGTTTQPHRPIGAGLNESSTRLRLDAWPGATTNTIKLYSVALWSGE